MRTDKCEAMSIVRTMLLIVLPNSRFVQPQQFISWFLVKTVVVYIHFQSQ